MSEYHFKIYYEDLSLTFSTKFAVLVLCSTVARFYAELSALVLST